LVHVHDFLHLRYPLTATNGYLYHEILIDGTGGDGTVDDLFIIYTSIITYSNKELMKYLIGIPKLADRP